MLHYLRIYSPVIFRSSFITDIRVCFLTTSEKESELEKYIKTESLVPCLKVGLIYLSLFNPKKIYNINFTDMIIITLSSTILFYLIESYYL